MSLLWTIHGHVQGIGFRWFVRSMAQRQGIRGWVRNLPDGGVQIEAHGTETDLGIFTRAVCTGHPAAVFRSEERTSIPEPAPLPENFSIRY